MKYFMLSIFFIILLPLSAENITTLNGKEYKDYSLIRVTPTDLVISFKDGVASIPFSNLPKEIRKKYHYSHKRAKKYRKHQQALKNLIEKEKNKLVKSGEQELKKEQKQQSSEKKKMAQQASDEANYLKTTNENNMDTYVYHDNDDGPIVTYDDGDIVPLLYNNWHHVRRWHPYHHYHPYHPWHHYHHLVYQPHNLYRSCNRSIPRISHARNFGPRISHVGGFGGFHGGGFHGGGFGGGHR